jgi:hypothetical protein
LQPNFGRLSKKFYLKSKKNSFSVGQGSQSGVQWVFKAHPFPLNRRIGFEDPFDLLCNFAIEINDPAGEDLVERLECF